MSEDRLHPVMKAWEDRAYIDNATYLQMYEQSIADPDTFWAEQADELLTWSKKWDTVQEQDTIVHIFAGSKAGNSMFARMRMIDTSPRADQTAIIWESDDPSVDEHISYRDLHERVCRFSNVLKSRGVRKGDRVSIYMPMVVEAAVAMLSCARIGAVHSVVFGGFSPEALKDRILDSDCQVVITADEGIRGAKTHPPKGEHRSSGSGLSKCAYCGCHSAHWGRD